MFDVAVTGLWVRHGCSSVGMPEKNPAPTGLNSATQTGAARHRLIYQSLCFQPAATVTPRRSSAQGTFLIEEYC